MTKSTHKVVCDKNVIYYSEFIRNSEVDTEFGEASKKLTRILAREPKDFFITKEV